MTAMRGPADADHYRVKVGRFNQRWYADPLPADDIADATDGHWPAISTVKPPFANKYYGLGLTADMDPAEWRRLAELDRDARYEALKTHDKLTGRVNMDRGTIVHEWAEQLIAGLPMATKLDANPAAIKQATRYQNSLRAFFDDHQPDPLVVEAVCIHRDLNGGVGYGGTADLFARIDGANWIVDWKTRGSSHDTYPEEAAQLGGYGRAQYMIVENDGAPSRAKIPDLAGGLVVSITSDSYRIYPIDLDEAFTLFTDMHQWWATQRDHNAIGKPWAPAPKARQGRPDGSGVPSGPVTTRGDSPMSSPAGPARTRSPIPEQIGKLRQRLTNLVNNTGCGLDDVRQSWPDGCPPLTVIEGHTADTLDRIGGMVALLETSYGWEPATADEIVAYKERLEALPPDLFGQAQTEAVAARIPNLLDGEGGPAVGHVMRTHLATLDTIATTIEDLHT